jgi:hypothetical protein
MVGEEVAPLTATPEPDVTVSRYPAPQYEGHCHWHFLPWISSWQWPCSNIRLEYRLFSRSLFQ